MLADRPWVLLDEPTAHLDALTEQVIADTLVELGRDRAVVVVAHRPALVALADHVVQPRRHRRRCPSARRDRRAGEPAVVGRSARGSSPARSRWAPAPSLGALASAVRVALTATSGWLIVQASDPARVLTLLVAIVGVRTFGLARPVLRYAERLCRTTRPCACWLAVASRSAYVPEPVGYTT